MFAPLRAEKVVSAAETAVLEPEEAIRVSSGAAEDRWEEVRMLPALPSLGFSYELWKRLKELTNAIRCMVLFVLWARHVDDQSLD